MLVNNFKPLLFFGGGGNFKNVSGAVVSAGNLLPTIAGINETVLNGYERYGCGRSFNYNITAASNNYQDEQTAYNWNGIVANWGFNGGSGDANHAREAGFTLFVGEGATPETSEDYKLDSPLVLTVTSASCIQNSQGTVTVARTFQNNTQNEVTVKEKGLYIFSYYNNQNSYAVMIGRKVLDTPVTIPIGASYTFTTTIDMTQVTFSEADN